MLQAVQVSADSPLSLPIESADPSAPVVVTSITGLDPADVTLFTGDFARDGGYYQGRRSGARNVVLNLKLNADYANDIDVATIREGLYSTFFEPVMGTDGVLLTFEDDTHSDRYLIGYTEKMPAPLFEKDTRAQVSLLCVQPFFLDVIPSSGNDAVGWTTLPVTYEGSAKTGLFMSLKVKTATSVINVFINEQGSLSHMTLNGTFAVNDIVEINTLIGSRSIRQNGSDIMAKLTAASKWTQLRRGVNTFKVHGGALDDGKVALMSYSYNNAWWGI